MGSQRRRMLALHWFLVMVPQFIFIQYSWWGKNTTTIQCAHIFFSCIIFVTVFTVDKVIASTKCLHPQLQTRLLVVLAIKHLQPLHSCGKMPWWFLQKVYKAMPRKGHWKWHVVICELSYHDQWSLMINHMKTNYTTTKITRCLWQQRKNPYTLSFSALSSFLLFTSVTCIHFSWFLLCGSMPMLLGFTPLLPFLFVHFYVLLCDVLPLPSCQSCHPAKKHFLQVIMCH